MSRRANIQPKFGRPTFEAKLRRPGDRLDRNGDKVEGGKVFSRHFEASDSDHAKRVALKLAKKLGSRIVSIGKVHPEDIIGDHNRWGLKGIIGKPMLEGGRSVIRDNVTLSEIVYGKLK